MKQVPMPVFEQMKRIRVAYPDYFEWYEEWLAEELKALPCVQGEVKVAQGRCLVLMEIDSLHKKLAQGK